MRQPIAETDITVLPVELPEGLVVLDVREDDEWRAGHIDGALHVPLAQVQQRMGDLPVDQQVLVVCRVGARSSKATALLSAQGYDAVNLAGGMLAWEQAQRPMVSDTDAPPQVI